MSGPDKTRRRWLEWLLLPLKALVLLSLPFLFFADSQRVPWLTPLDISLDMLAGWLCLFCALTFVVAAGFQRIVGPPGEARRSIVFAVIAFLLGITLSPLFAIK